MDVQRDGLGLIGTSAMQDLIVFVTIIPVLYVSSAILKCRCEDDGTKYPCFPKARSPSIKTVSGHVYLEEISIFTTSVDIGRGRSLNVNGVREAIVVGNRISRTGN